MADWPQLLNRADDICSLAEVGFVAACRAGRIAPDPQTGRHSASSVAGYTFGIVNRLFANEFRRLRPRPEPLDCLGEPAAAPADDALALLAQGGPEEGDSRLWGVLRSARSACRPEDIIVAYLLASGMSSAEVGTLLSVSENTPGNALKRVGRELRRQLEFEGESRGPRAKGQREEDKGRSPAPSQMEVGTAPEGGHRSPPLPTGIAGQAPALPQDSGPRTLDSGLADASADARATRTRGGPPR
jgi:DNA-directed RNA polymerase specialized sigma24 family protein